MESLVNIDESSSPMTSEVTMDIAGTPKTNPSESGSGERTLPIIYVIIGCVGITGNAFVILVMLMKRKLLKRPANTFICNQSIIDMAAAVHLLAFYAPVINGPIDYSGYSGFMLCKIVGGQGILWGLLTASTYNMLSLTAERYLQIVFPLFHKVRMTKKVTVTVMIIVWVCGMTYLQALSIPTAVVINGSCYTLGSWPNQQSQRAVAIINLFVMYFFPLSLVVYMYSHVGFVLHRRARVHLNVAGNSHQSQSMSRAQRSLVKTVCLVTACFVICWSSAEFNFVLVLCGYGWGFTTMPYHFTVMMVFVNCSINPFLYSAQHFEFQKAVDQLFCRHFRKADVSSAT